ncbi:MAG TPA: 2-phosphosulfolactate phosphatase [Candidatus Eisenbacteria bacterium]|nr:2-phosphosulfolactate phosphatase [Candidatus Eisenbacteria bacterium]
MKRLDLYLTPRAAERAPLDHRQVVVVDVLRSCTTLAHALRRGAAKVIPVASVEEATRLAQTLDPKQRLLCGERDGAKVSGFDLGNSPREYEAGRVEGKTLVFASTNASPLMSGLLIGREQRLLSYVNLSAAADAVCADGSDLVIVCAGRNGRVSLEDTACAGALVRRLVERCATGEEPAMNDSAELAAAYDRLHGHDPEAILRKSDHGRYLIELGFEADLPVCAAVDSVPIVPFLRDGRIMRGSDAYRGV